MNTTFSVHFGQSSHKPGVAARAAVTLTAITALSGGTAATASASSHSVGDQVSISARSHQKPTAEETRKIVDNLRNTVENLQSDCLLEGDSKISADELKFRCHDMIQEGQRVQKLLAEGGYKEGDALKDALDDAKKKLDEAAEVKPNDAIDITSDLLVHLLVAAIAGILGGALGLKKSRSNG